jgi:hypothetical protein
MTAHHIAARSARFILSASLRPLRASLGWSLADGVSACPKPRDDSELEYIGASSYIVPPGIHRPCPMGPGVTFAGIPAPGQAPAQAAASLQVEQAGGVPPPPAQNGWTPRAAGPLRPRPAPYPMASRLLAAGSWASLFEGAWLQIRGGATDARTDEVDLFPVL